MTITNMVVTPEGQTQVPLTAEELVELNAYRQAEINKEPAKALNLIRLERNQFLAETDWWGASDQTMTDAQTTYRQALRDYPATYEADNSSAWPIKP